MLGLGYPGGQVIDRLAREGDPEKIAFPRAYLERTAFDFSFSGIKTAVNRYIQTHPDGMADRMPDIAAGFQEAVVEVLSYKLVRAAIAKGCGHVAVVGGVAANSRLREKVKADAAEQDLRVHVPPVALCGDNAAMIASVGYHHIQAGRQTGLDADVYSRVS
jgi:N6-L-threonylcarbamoyladenine synthase